MNILLMGGAGFIGTNLALKLAQNQEDLITIVDRDIRFFDEIKKYNLDNIKYIESEFSEKTDFKHLVDGQDVVYHLVSTTVPTTSNVHVPQELTANVVVTSYMLEACVECNVKKVVFLSSGGTVYGVNTMCPIKEDTPTDPISSYGIQKVTIEKLLYLYHYMYGLDYRVVRLANPYGPFQRPNGVLGAVTTFTYKALNDEAICVYGDGSVIRDFIYIDDAVCAILNIVQTDSEYKVFNVGSGYGTSINELINTIKEVLNKDIIVEYKESRKMDVPINYLDIGRYVQIFGETNMITLQEGVKRTAEFLRGSELK